MSQYRAYFVLGKMDPLGRQEDDGLRVIADFMSSMRFKKFPKSSTIISDLEKEYEAAGEELTVGCQNAIANLERIKHPAVVRALECNVSIYCGKCKSSNGSFGGITHYSEEGGYAHVCIDESVEAPYSQFEALILHELIHVGQYLDSGHCGCKDTPYVGKAPNIVGVVGGKKCEECRDSERPAYQAQAEYLYPKGLHGADEFHKKYVEQGLLFSCRTACGTRKRAVFPEVPFILEPLVPFSIEESIKP